MLKELYSENTEKALLGLLISNPELIKNIIGLLDNNDFYFKDNSLVFISIKNSFSTNNSVDEILIIEELAKLSSKPKTYWVEYLGQLIFQKGIETNIEKYIEIIKEKSQKRNLERTLKDSVKLVTEDNQSISSLIGQVETKIKQINQDKDLKDFDNIENLTDEYKLKLQKMKDPNYQDGLKTRLSTLDERLGGLQGGQFIIVAARPSMGKTTFALEIVKNISKNHNVGLFSLEMPADQLITRLISSESMIDSKSFLKPKLMNQITKQRLNSGIETIRNLKLWIDDSASLKIGEISWKVRKLNDLHNLDLIVIDYLQLIDSDSKSTDNRQQVISDISRKLKALSRELNIPIIALSQLSRRVEQREDKRPQMSDLRESGAIEQDADIVMFLYRDDYYKHKESSEAKPISEMEVIISKHRNGPTGITKLGLDLRYGKVTVLNIMYNREE